MNYISTRNSNGIGVSSAQAIKQGLAGDGGLFMPEEIPDFTEDDLRKLCEMDYPKRAAYILSRFLTDYTYDELLSDCEFAYSESRFPGGAAPIVPLGNNIRILELWHGPTAAFKDMALQIMPRLLSRALVKTDEKRTAFILVATSGDTGKAALEGYRDVDGVKMMVFYPANGVSKIQKIQMASQEGSNVSVCAVKGNFDDTQNGVKKIFSDPAASEYLNRKNMFLSSANSINWGRLVPQIVYYISAYCDMVNNRDIELGDEINVSVPTGNFGNIFAAYVAKQTGLPINRFICASNCNNILTDFFETGAYDRNRTFYTTMSPSMDILISSNLERLLYLTGGSECTAGYMKRLSETGKYIIDDNIKSKLDHDFSGTWCSETDTSFTIKNIYNKTGYLSDTHTAVALHAALYYYGISGDKRKILVTSTASPFKFASSVYYSITGKALENEFDAIEDLSKMTGVPVPKPLADMASRKIRFDKVIDSSSMINEVYSMN